MTTTKPVFLAMVVTLLLFFISVTSLSWVYFYYYFSSPPETGRVVLIPSGSSVKKISYILSDAGAISHPFVFELCVRLSGNDRLFKAGEYALTPDMSPADIVERLVKGDVIIRDITIPEGFMMFQVLERLQQASGLVGDVTIPAAEGSILPETYYYHYGDSRNQILQRMQKNMQDFLEQAWEARDPSVPLRSQQEALVLASIVEKETGVPEERGRVAAVFINRLRKGMMLQSDPTVSYGITKGASLLERNLFTGDLKRPSAYNTYTNYGLPPTAIANPGKASILAALNPPRTEDLYFVADGTGGHAFAKNLKEHQIHVQKWRKLQRNIDVK